LKEKEVIMLDIHSGINAEDSIVMKTGRISLELLDETHIEAFYLGFSDRICEEHDERNYLRVDNLKTILEVFYYLGYKISSKEIMYSDIIKKSLPTMRGFRKSILTYLDRFNIVSFYEKNSQVIQQMLP
jgi:hypothetical protein